MKQKNMLLVAVAVVCGLIAAFLTSQMSARTKKQPVIETVDVPVAAADLPTGTKLKPEDFDKYVKIIKMPKDNLPPAFVEDTAMLKDKRLTRTMRVNDVFNPADITLNGPINLPENHSLMTVRCTLEEGVAGFIQPGVKVDVIASVQMKKSQKRIIFPLFTDLLVMAIDSTSAPPKDGQQSFGAMNMVSFAVNAENSLLLQGAVTSGANMRLTLRHPDKPVVYAPYTQEEIWDILSGTAEEREEKKNHQASENAKVEMIKVKVPTKDLAAGSAITKEFLEKNFTEIDYPKERIPENTAKEWATHLEKGDYLLKDVAANHFVPKSFLGAQVLEPKKAGPDETGSSPKSEPKEPKDVAKPVGPKPEFVDVTVNSVRGTVRHRYLKLPNGDHKYLGVIVDPDEPAADEKKPEDKKPSEDSKNSPIQ